MADIFLSYAHEDEARIRHLATALEMEGWSIFWDRQIPAGKTWRSTLGEALKNSRCVVVAWSQHSIDSSWVAEEADEGQRRGILVPVLLDSVDPPIGFRNIQGADLADWKLDSESPRFRQLVQNIGAVAAPDSAVAEVRPDYRQPLGEYLARVSDLYTELPINKSFIPLSADDPAGVHIPNVLQDLKQTICEDPDTFALVLGEYGSGKTSLMYRLAYELAQDVLGGATDVPTPLYLSLGFARGKPSIPHAFSDFVGRYGIDMPARFLRKLLNSKPNLVFILDGFDEMANRTEWSEVPAILDKLSELQVSRGIRLVITSRTTFFRERLDEELVPATKRVYLSPLDDDQITKYIAKNQPEKVEQVKVFLDKSPEIRGLCRFPIHLMLCVDYLSGHDPAAENFQPIEIYSSFINKNLLINASTNPEWGLAERRNTVRRLAYKWFQEETFEVSVEDVRRELQKEIPDLLLADYRSLAMQLLNCSFFMRIVDRYRFFHYSFLEYFAAETLVQDLYNEKLESWNERPLYAELFDFMAQMIYQKGIGRLPINRIVECDLGLLQSNFLATMYRRPIDEVWTVFDRLLLSSSHPLVRCVASQGIGLSTTRKSIDSLAAAFKNESNSVLKAIYRTLIRGLEEKVNGNGDAPVDLEDAVELVEDDAEAVLGTKRSQFALEAYRKALLIGDQRWTSTVASIYLLATIGDNDSAEAIERIGSGTKLTPVRNAFEEVVPLLSG